jgi:hypothetical protein
MALLLLTVTELPIASTLLLYLCGFDGFRGLGGLGGLDRLGGLWYLRRIPLGGRYGLCGVAGRVVGLDNEVLNIARVVLHIPDLEDANRERSIWR